jgi:hypothetical protein
VIVKESDEVEDNREDVEESVMREVWVVLQLSSSQDPLETQIKVKNESVVNSNVQSNNSNDVPPFIVITGIEG